MAIHEQEPVRTLREDDRRLPRALLQQLKDARATQAEAMVAGASQTFDHYRNAVGVIQGLDLAIALCVAAQAKLDA